MQMNSNISVTKQTNKQSEIYVYQDWLSKLSWKIGLFVLYNEHQKCLDKSLCLHCLTWVLDLTTITCWHTDIDTKLTFTAVVLNEKTNLQIKWWSNSVEALLTRSGKGFLTTFVTSDNLGKGLFSGFIEGHDPESTNLTWKMITFNMNW